MLEIAVRRARLVRDTVDLSCAVVQGEDVLEQLFEVLLRFVGADVVTLSMDLSVAADTDPTLIVRGTHDLGDEERARWRVLLPTHPYARHLVSGPDTASRMSDHADLRELHRSDVFQVLLRPRELNHQAAAVLERDTGGMTLLCLWRAAHDFTDDEVRLIEEVRAALQDAARLRHRLDALERHEARSSRGDVTARQRQVAALVALGCTNDQIARRLGISPRTVRKHVEDLFAASGCDNRVALALWWRQGGASATGPRLWPPRRLDPVPPAWGDGTSSPRPGGCRVWASP